MRTCTWQYMKSKLRNLFSFSVSESSSFHFLEKSIYLLSALIMHTYLNSQIVFLSIKINRGFAIDFSDTQFPIHTSLCQVLFVMQSDDICYCYDLAFCNYYIYLFSLLLKQQECLVLYQFFHVISFMWRKCE